MTTGSTPSQATLRRRAHKSGRLRHRDDCIHLPYYEGNDCESNVGVWNQPPGWAFNEAKGEFDDAPYCVVHQRAWELVTEDA